MFRLLIVPSDHFGDGNKMIYDGMWNGRRCFIIGGGPSLKSFDWSLLSDELTIGINAAWKLVPTIAFIRDVRYMREVMDDPKFNSCASHKVFHRGSMPEELRTPHDIISAGHKWGRTLEDGLVYSADAGLCALNLACALGADPVYLMGYDMRGDGKLTSNWHNDYPEQWRTNESVYAERFIPAYEKYKPDMRSLVVNLSPHSALTCFPFAAVEDVLPCHASRTA